LGIRRLRARNAKAIILGHGNLKKAADTSGVKTRTIERIALTGKGLISKTSKIRKKTY
jgi:hypothetical protein